MKKRLALAAAFAFSIIPFTSFAGHLEPDESEIKKGGELVSTKLEDYDLFSNNFSDDILIADVKRCGYNIAAEANLSNADLTEANLSVADLSQTNLQEAKIRQANLEGTLLIDADLRHANLGSTNLMFADLSNADLYKANLTNASIAEAKFCGTTLPDGKISNRDC